MKTIVFFMTFFVTVFTLSSECLVVITDNGSGNSSKFADIQLIPSMASDTCAQEAGELGNAYYRGLENSQEGVNVMVGFRFFDRQNGTVTSGSFAASAAKKK